MFSSISNKIKQSHVIWPLERIAEVTEKALFGFSIYIFPLFFLLLTLIALFFWDPHFFTPGAQQIPFRYMQEEASPLTPQVALSSLERQRPTSQVESILSDASFWFLFTAPEPSHPNEGTVVELPSRVTSELSCWDTPDFLSIGHATRDQAWGGIKRVKAGFAIDMGHAGQGESVICKGKFPGPAHINFLSTTAWEIEQGSKKFHHDSGLLEGGLLMLVAFSLIAAVINKEITYLLFAAWLITALRVALISSGGDMQWFGYTIPETWLIPIKKLSFSLYYILTTALFSQLFSAAIKQLKCSHLLAAVQLMSLPLLLMALAVSTPSFFLWLWSISGVAIVTLSYLLFKIIRATKSKVAWLYVFSIAIILLSSVSEVIAAAFGYQSPLRIVNHTTGATLSSLVVALAIAEQMRLDRQEKISAQEELKHTYEAIPIGLFTLNDHGAMISFNPALQSILHIGSHASSTLCTWQKLFGEEVWNNLSESARSSRGCEMEVAFHPRSSSVTRWLQIKATYAQGRIEGSLQDVTVRHIASEKLKFLADHDPLTGVLNRRGIENALVSKIESLPKGESTMLAYLDLDRFKLTNDLYGHIAGDDVLRQVCQRALKILDGAHTIGRLSGDEFIILFKTGTMESNSTLCEHLLSAIETRPYLLDGKAFQLRASIGLVEISDNTKVADAISAADRACREAKKGAQGHLQTYEKSSAFFRERASELEMIERFSSHRIPEGLFLEMQPILSLREPFATHNFETLIRMRDRDGSLIPAHRIISAAESNGNSGIIDRWVLSSILAWLDDHLPALDNTRFVCLNLSGASLNDERFIEDAFSILRNHPKSSDRICIEITEGVALNDLAMTRRFIDGARKYGSKIALDDFGAGYTSFSYLRELKADAVKIDGSFVRDVCKHPTNLSIVATIAELARNLGMQSIAEWAEDMMSVEALADIGVDYVQGWAISKSLSAEMILSVNSSAELIQDEAMARFVRDNLPSKIQQPGAAPFSIH
jgi:diguanylate cyclase (GGDEF)-like protein